MLVKEIDRKFSKWDWCLLTTYLIKTPIDQTSSSFSIVLKLLMLEVCETRLKNINSSEINLLVY